jgi:small subunit ribosomal protein S16
MAVRIRLRREGTKNSPFYRIVVANSQSPRDGKFLEMVGTYDPKKKQNNIDLKLDRIDYWIQKGATASETVSSFIRKARKTSVAA